MLNHQIILMGILNSFIEGKIQMEIVWLSNNFNRNNNNNNSIYKIRIFNNNSNNKNNNNVFNKTIEYLKKLILIKNKINYVLILKSIYLNILYY